MSGRTDVGGRKRRAFVGAAAAALLAALGVIRAGAGEDAKAPAGKDAANTALAEHEEARKQLEDKCIVLATCFPTAQAMHSLVTAQGQRQMLKGGMAFPQPALDQANLDVLLAALRKLPEGKAAQKSADALVISWREKDAWKTRQYDRTDLPLEAAALLGLLGVPEGRPMRR